MLDDLLDLARENQGVVNLALGAAGLLAGRACWWAVGSCLRAGWRGAAWCLTRRPPGPLAHEVQVLLDGIGEAELTSVAHGTLHFGRTWVTPYGVHVGATWGDSADVTKHYSRRELAAVREAHRTRLAAITDAQRDHLRKKAAYGDAAGECPRGNGRRPAA